MSLQLSIGWTRKAIDKEDDVFRVTDKLRLLYSTKLLLVEENVKQLKGLIIKNGPI
jgi:hypothetical protein